VTLLPAPDWAPDVSSKAGSSPSRDFGGVSTVELRVCPVPERDGAVTDAAGESDPRYSDAGGTALDGAAGSSVVTVAPVPQFVQGVVTRAGAV
jgi:hypothetical protein